MQPGHCTWAALDNVVMSPHVGGAWAAEGRAEIRIGELAILLNALARGEMMNLVDPDAGY